MVTSLMAHNQLTSFCMIMFIADVQCLSLQTTCLDCHAVKKTTIALL